MLLNSHFGMSLSDIHHNPDSDEYITSNYKDQDTELDLVSAGSGSLQIVQILSYIFLTNPGAILLDEPDAHLHSSLQRKLIDFLYELSQANDIQVLLSTHSKEIINYLDPGFICTVAKGDKSVIRASSYPEIVSLLNNLGNVDNIDLALILKYRKCLFVEGKSDRIIKRFAALKGSKIFEGDDQVIIFPIKGEGNIEKYGEFIKVLEALLKTGIRNAFLRDRDYMTDNMMNKYSTEYKNRNLNVNILNRKEIENYVLIPQVLKRVVEKEYTRRYDKETIIDINEISRMLDESCESLKNDVIFAIQDKIIKYERPSTGIDYPTAGKKALDYVNSKWKTLENKLSIVPGNEILSKFTSLCQEKWGISFSLNSVLFSMTAEEVDTELFEFIDTIEHL
jgi:predicted ATP-dependent endonuclease of OLD family